MSERNGDYRSFLAAKAHADDRFGFEPLWLHPKMKPFQSHCTEWAIRKGRGALLEECGLGKTLQEHVWAENVVRKTNKPVLILCPLAVAPQMVREGAKFGIDVHHCRDGKVRKGINVVNYERLKLFDPAKVAGVVLDEAGCIKHFEGKFRFALTKFLRNIRYRLFATATPAPNDWMELGSHSEALGVMGRNQMLGMFFTNGGETTQQWELKGHAKKRFWRWVASWARALRKPSDLGFSDAGYELPPIEVKQHIVKTPDRINGHGFDVLGAVTLDEQRAERNRTITERCERVAELVPKDDFCVAWCHLNPEGELLTKLIPGAVEVAGRHSDDEKEEKLAAFAAGQIKTLVTKPKIGGWGLNWQHCNRMTTFPSHSFEAYYQMVRRCHRFGQKRPVGVDIVSTRGESRVMANMQRKERSADAMFAALVEQMGEWQVGVKRVQETTKVRVPGWLRA